MFAQAHLQYDIVKRAYPEEARYAASANVAVLRAMRSVARKYPNKFVLRGGKGRAPLVIMKAKAAVEWDEAFPALRR